MSSGSNDEITVTLVSPVGQSESISVGPVSTTLNDLNEWAKALFGLDGDQPITLSKDGKVLSAASSQSLADAGIVHGDLLAVRPAAAAVPTRAPVRVTVPSPPATAAAAAAGGLDFTNLLASAAPAPSTSTSTTTTTVTPPPPPVYYPGMHLEDAMSYNRHPRQFVELLRQHDSLFKELNYHQPRLAKLLKEAPSVEAATAIYRDECVKGGIRGALQQTEQYHKEMEYQQRLSVNPNDEEAKEYFAKKNAKQEIMSQYFQVMNEYPESMGRVLMLYIEAKVNGHSIQAFVDSGAQTTIMSKRKAQECGILHMVDERFAGIAVGVGTGKILGRIHLVSLQIGQSHFPCTVTVMDDGGMGDKNMDFLLGLDMLKRHLCHIDLEHHCLKFQLAPGTYMEAPFLHEKDLDESKGGTKGFNADKANEQLMKEREEEDDDVDAMGGDGAS